MSLYKPYLEINFGTTMNDTSLFVKSDTSGYNSDLLSLFFSNFDYEKNWLLASYKTIGDKLYPIPYYESQVDFSAYNSLSNLQPLQMTAGYHGKNLSQDDCSIEDKIIVRFSGRKINKINITFDKEVYATDFTISLGFLSESEYVYEKQVASNGMSILSVPLDYTGKVRFLTLKFSRLSHANRRLIINNIQIAYTKRFDEDSIVSIKYSKKKNTSKDISGIIYKTANITLINTDRDFDFLNPNSLSIPFGYATMKLYFHDGITHRCILSAIVKEWDSSEKDLTVKISCIDYLKYLENIQNYEKIAQNYSFFDALSNNLKKIGIKQVVANETLKEKTIDVYYTNMSISKTILSLAEASNVLVKTNPQEDSAILFDVDLLYYYPIKRLFDLSQLADYSQEKPVLNPNSIEYTTKGKTFEFEQYIAKSITLFHTSFIKRDLPSDFEDERYIYTLGYEIEPSYSLQINYSELAITKESFLRVEITDVIIKGSFEYVIDVKDDCVSVNFWIFDEIDSTAQSEVTVIAKRIGASVCISSVMQDIPSQIESLKYYLPYESDTVSRNQLVEPFVLNSSVNDIVEIDSIVSKNQFVKGSFEYIIDKKSDGYVAKVWNYTSYPQSFAFDLYGRKLIDKDEKVTLKEFDSQRMEEEGENKKVIDDNIYLENKQNTTSKLKSLINLYRVYHENFKDIKIKVRSFKDFELGVCDVIVTESIRGYGFLPILINGVSLSYDKNGLNLQFEGARLASQIFYPDDIYDSFALDDSVLQ